MTTRHGALYLLAFALALTACGCAATHTMFATLNAPSRSRLVGGGQSIEFKAPEAGTVYLMIHGNLRLSRSVSKGEKLQWSRRAGLSNTPGIHRMCNHARLYFEPRKAPDDGSKNP